jgi:Polyketide cyclase / dehydrase and lipid transport
MSARDGFPCRILPRRSERKHPRMDPAKQGKYRYDGKNRKSLLIVIAFAALALPRAGWAHGPSRQKITETIEIDAPPAKVWAAIADFHDMSWLPGVAKTTGEGGNEPDVATRQLTVDGGATIDESLYKYNAGAMSYSYRIDKVDVKVLPVDNYSSTITVLPAEGGKSTVEWRGRPLSRLPKQ